MKKKEKLLNEIGAVNKKGKELSILKGENFNVFQIFDMERDENKMHSRFIETLLNPKGSHDRGTVFLKLFLETISRESYFDDLENVNTKVEHYIGGKNIIKGNNGDGNNDSAGGRIDIYLWDVKNSLSIENKIDAGDEEKQIVRYSNYNKDNNIVYYLNLYGDSPSNDSKGSLKSNIDFYCISYSETILNWLEKCQKEVSDFPIIRETIKQYSITIKRLTGQLINQEMKEEIKNLIKANFKSANTIANNIEKVKIEVVDGFLDELKTNLENKLRKNEEKEDGNTSKEKNDSWSIKFKENKKDKQAYRSLRIIKKSVNIVLQGQPLFWKNETILGLSSNKGSEDVKNIWKELKQEELKRKKKNLKYQLIEDKYSKNNEFWLFYRTIFNFEKIDDFTKLLQNDSRKKLIKDVTDEIISLTKKFDEII
jgi:hypothetical protein